MRIYHPYTVWEDWKHGFYDNCSGQKKIAFIDKVLEMFNSEELTRDNMRRVIHEWVYSCEHNLSNMDMNRIAYLGQAACSIYAGVPNTITMEAWNLLDNEVQERADRIAEEVINEWESERGQLCLRIT